VVSLRNSSIVVTDSGPLIVLAVASLLDLTCNTFGPLRVPEAVFAECTAQDYLPGSKTIQDCLAKGSFQIVANLELDTLDAAYGAGLGGAEVATLAYAKHHNCLALIDEKRARRIASALSVSVVGSGTILVALKHRAIISSVKPALKTWREHGYFFSSAVIEQILLQANENE
jgi:predicted nucleic acid-binding protein